jgi:hypothetical protein
MIPIDSPFGTADEIKGYKAKAELTTTGGITNGQ